MRSAHVNGPGKPGLSGDLNGIGNTVIFPVLRGTMAMQPSPYTSLSLFAHDGRRKYLTPAERTAFIAAAHACTHAQVRALCLLLAYTGCRISEALALTPAAFDPHENFVVLRSLKKRGRIMLREVPLPEWLVASILALAEGDRRLWPWSRGWAWVLVKQVMMQAGVMGLQASPKGLRHGFAIHAIRSGVPLNLVQRWLGHASIATTAIYADALGAEEREIAARMWEPQT